MDLKLNLIKLKLNTEQIKQRILSNLPKPLSIRSFIDVLAKRGRFFAQLTRIIPGIIIFCIILVFFHYDLLGRVQDTIADQFVYSRSTDKDIILIAIDDESLQRYGRWPWDRDIFAQIQEKLEKFDLKVIAWDLSFTEPSEHDDEFTNSLESDIPVVLASELSPQWQSGYLAPLPEFQKDNVTMGYFNLQKDQDGKIRSTSLFEYDRNRNCHKSFPLVIYELYTGENYENPCEKGIEEIPLEDGNSLIVNYSGPPGSIQQIPVSDFLEFDVIPESLEGKVVIIGVTARGVQAYKLTSIDSALMSGGEILGNVFHTLKEGRFILREEGRYQVLGIFAIVFLTMLIMRFQRVLMGSILIFGLINIYLLFAVWNLSNGLIMDLIYLPFAGLATWVVQLSINYYMNRQEEVYLRSAFEHYVSAKVLDEIIKDREKLSLGGDSKKLTVLFSDLRNFTSFAEKIPPKELVVLTNEYLTIMSDVILKEDGFIDKYIGDEIMAFWGAPLEDRMHPYNACRAALNMMKRLGEWKKEKGFTKEDFNIGIGINTGTMIVGNMGSDKRFSYTILGDSVNLGSRLEGLTKTYKVPIIISEYTYSALEGKDKVYTRRNRKNDAFVLRELDIVKVKGRDNPVRLYELVGIYEDSHARLANIEKFERALREYRNSEWNKAGKMFEELLDEDPAAYELFSRIKLLREKKRKSWDGIWEMQTK